MLGFKRRADALNYAESRYNHHKTINPKASREQIETEVLHDVSEHFAGAVDLALIIKIVMFFLSLVQEENK